MMNRLLIVGASGFGREILDWAGDIGPASRDWEIAGFLDANPAALEGFRNDYPVFGDPLTYAPLEGDRFICAIADPGTRLRICRHLKDRGGRFVTLIHPTSHFGSLNRIGEGCVFCPRSGITTNVSVGDFVILNTHAGIGHDSVVGDGCILNSFCDVGGQTVLGEGVFLGSHAVVLQGIKVGDFARIGAGSVIVRNVKAGITVFGNPAKQVAGFEPERP